MAEMINAVLVQDCKKIFAVLLNMKTKRSNANGTGLYRCKETYRT